MVAALSAARFAAQRDQLRNDFPGVVETFAWELVPGQTLAALRAPFRRRGAKAVFVFAEYLTPGDHRARGDPFAHLVVQLQERDFTLAERSATNP